MSNKPIPNNIKININLNIENPASDFRIPKYHNTHKDELCIGRKIENNKVNLLNVSETSNIKKFPIPIELLKPKKRSQNQSQNTSTAFGNETINELVDNTSMNKTKINMNNTSFNNQSLVVKRNINVNSSFHSQVPNQKIKKSRNKSKKQQLQDLLQQLQKLTPEIKDLLTQERKNSQSPPKKASFPIKINLKKKKKLVALKKTKKKSAEKNKSKSFINPNETECVKPCSNTSLNNQNIKKIINEKNKKIALKNLLNKQKEQEIEIKKNEKESFLMKRNEEIRKSNKMRFLSLPKKKAYKENKSQERLKPIYYKSPTKPKKLKNEKERREELGLSWLNDIDETQYEQILERNRSKSQEKSKENIINEIPKKKPQDRENSKELKKFILLKKKEYQNNVKQVQFQRKMNMIQKENKLKTLKEIINNIKQKSCKKSDKLKNTSLSNAGNTSKSPKKNQENQENQRKNINFDNKPPNMYTASFPNPMSRIPTENEHLDERIEIEELDKSSFSERNYLNTEFSMKSLKPIANNVSLKDEEVRNEAVIQIQKVWRGHKSRQIVEDYLRYLLREEEQYLEYLPEEVPTRIENSENRIENDSDERIFRESEENIFLKEPEQDHDIDQLNGEELIVYKESSEQEQIEDFLERTREEAKLNIDVQKDVEKKKREEFKKDVFMIRDNFIHDKKQENLNFDEKNSKNKNYTTDFIKNANKIDQKPEIRTLENIQQLRNEQDTSNYNNSKDSDERENKYDFMGRNHDMNNELIADFKNNNIQSKPKDVMNMRNKIKNDFMNQKAIPKQDSLHQESKNDSYKNMSSQDYQSEEIILGSKDLLKPHDYSNEKNSNISNILHYKEINENSKSLITVKDFEGDYSDLIDKDDYKISNKKNLNFSKDLLLNNSKQKQSLFLKKSREKSSTELLREQLMENLKSIEAMTKSTGNNSNVRNLDKNINEAVFMSNQHQEEEVQRLKEQQLTLWNEMMENLKRLQDSQLNPAIKNQIQQLELFSQTNIETLKGAKDVKIMLKPQIQSNIQTTNKPLLQINIEEENINQNNQISDKDKNTPSEGHPSCFLDSFQPNFKQFGITPPSKEHSNASESKPIIQDNQIFKNNNNTINHHNLIIDIEEFKQNELAIPKEPTLSKYKENNLKLEKNDNNHSDDLFKPFSNSQKTPQNVFKVKEGSHLEITNIKEIEKMTPKNTEDTTKTNKKEVSTQLPIESPQESPAETFKSNTKEPFKDNKNLTCEKDTSIFTLDPFQEFSLKHKSDQKKPQDLLEMREKVLEIRQEAEMKHMNQMLANKKFSPTSFEIKKREFEKWVSNEKNEINKTKNDLKKSWLRTADTIQKTKRDLAFMKKIAGKDFVDYSMKFSFSQDDLLRRPSFLFKSMDFIKKQEKNDKNFDNNEDLRSIEREIEKNNMEMMANSSKEFIKNENFNISFKREQQLTNISNDFLLNHSKELISNKSKELLTNKSNELLLTNHSKELLTNHSKELITCKSKPSKENDNAPISREELFEDYKESERNGTEEEESNRIYQNYENKQIDDKKTDHEVIKLDFFMDFQDLEEELINTEDEILRLEENPIEELTQNNENLLKYIERPIDIQNNNFPSKEQVVSDDILDDLIQEMLKEPILMKNKDFLYNILIKRNHNVILHNKEFDSQFPKSTENFSLIKSQEFLKTENSRIASSGSTIIKEYLKYLKDYLVSNINTPLGQKILSQINTPLGYNSLDKLRFLHKNLYKFSAQLAENIMIPYVDREVPRIPVIPNDGFQLINDEIVKKSSLSLSFPEEVKEDYFRLIFNSFNESLDCFRPYNLKGQPNFLKCVKNKKIDAINEKNIEDIYVKAVVKTLEWSDTLCGLLPDKDEKTLENINDVDMDSINQIREEKMGRMLAQEVIESEGDWVNYQEEEIEIKLEISQLVWEEFLWQNVNDICKLIEKR